MTVDATDAPAGRTFRLATWNMNHWQTPTERRAEAWEWLRSGGSLDVALLQETVPPVSLARERVVYHEIAGRRPWGSAVVAFGDGIEVEEIWSVSGGSRYRHRVATTHPGSVAVARVHVPGIAPITAVSVYNLLDGSPTANLLRVTADLVPLLDSVDGDRVILGGDLNVFGAVAEGHRTRAGAIFGLLASLGLHPVGSLEHVERPSSAPDCPCGKGGSCGHIPTWKGFDLDHLFVSAGLRDQVRSLTVDQGVADRGLSDHAALVLGMELSAAPVAHSWDAESSWRSGRATALMPPWSSGPSSPGLSRRRRRSGPLVSATVGSPTSTSRGPSTRPCTSG
jgi:endonuclease/exonuclease/phosphatase family metal-dependent hydrolase